MRFHSKSIPMKTDRTKHQRQRDRHQKPFWFQKRRHRNKSLWCVLSRHFSQRIYQHDIFRWLWKTFGSISSCRVVAFHNGWQPKKAVYVVAVVLFISHSVFFLVYLNGLGDSLRQKPTTVDIGINWIWNGADAFRHTHTHKAHLQRAFRVSTHQLLWKWHAIDGSTVIFTAIQVPFHLTYMKHFRSFSTQPVFLAINQLVMCMLWARQFQ